MGFGETTDKRIEEVAKVVVDAIFQVHSQLGPGLLESIYEHCLCLELMSRGLNVQRQVVVPIIYREQEIKPGLKLDVLVEGIIIVEIKSVEAMHPVFQSQLLTYLKLAKLRLGILVNFNVPLIKDGIKRVIL